METACAPRLAAIRLRRIPHAWPRPQAAAQPHFSLARIEDDEIYGHPFSSFPPPALAGELFMELSGQCRLSWLAYCGTGINMDAPAAMGLLTTSDLCMLR